MTPGQDSGVVTGPGARTVLITGAAGGLGRSLALGFAEQGYRVLYLRNADDALELKARVPDVRNAVVIGGGFIGLEAAASLHSLGTVVTLLEAGPRVAGRAVGEQTSAELTERHRAAGITIETDARVRRIVSTGGDRVGGVEMADGRIIPADLVLIGIGVIPNTELAELIGLRCEDGIWVDQFSVASDGVTIAVGDVANLPNPIPGSDPGDRVRFESVQQRRRAGQGRRLRDHRPTAT